MLKNFWFKALIVVGVLLIAGIVVAANAPDGTGSLARLVGLGADGKFKYVNTDNNGNLSVTTAAGVPVEVQGTLAAAAAAGTQKPVTVAGVDSAGNIQRLRSLTDRTLVVASASGDSYLAARPTTVTLAASVSNAITGLTVNTCYTISCQADSRYLQGTGTPTALVTDNFVPARTPFTKCLTGSNTAIAFISTSATTCDVSLVSAP